jgi:hypothetical protein
MVGRAWKDRGMEFDGYEGFREKVAEILRREGCSDELHLATRMQPFLQFTNVRDVIYASSEIKPSMFDYAPPERPYLESFDAIIEAFCPALPVATYNRIANEVLTRHVARDVRHEDQGRLSDYDLVWVDLPSLWDAMLKRHLVADVDAKPEVTHGRSIR